MNDNPSRKSAWTSCVDSEAILDDLKKGVERLKEKRSPNPEWIPDDEPETLMEEFKGIKQILRHKPIDQTLVAESAPKTLFPWRGKRPIDWKGKPVDKERKKWREKKRYGK